MKKTKDHLSMPLIRRRTDVSSVGSYKELNLLIFFLFRVNLSTTHPRL